MTLLTIAQDVCDLAGIERPSSIATTSDTRYAQVRGVIQQATKDVAGRHDWRVLYGFQNVANDGLALPADYARMADPSNVRRLNIKALLAGTITTSNLFVDPESVERDGYDYHRLLDGSYVYPDGAALGNRSIRVYIRKNAVLRADSTLTDRWSQDTDTSILPEDLIMLGALWRWKSGKGFAYAEDLANYERELERLSSADNALGTLVVADQRPWWPDPYTSSPTPSGPINASGLGILASGGYDD